MIGSRAGGIRSRRFVICGVLPSLWGIVLEDGRRNKAAISDTIKKGGWIRNQAARLYYEIGVKVVKNKLTPAHNKSPQQ